jgi:hypothetical protein
MSVKKTFPENCNDSCRAVTVHICQLGALHLVVYGHWGQPLSTPYVITYEGLRYVLATFDHHRCKNSGLIAEGVGSIVRILPHTVMNIVPYKTWKAPIIAYLRY